MATERSVMDGVVVQTGEGRPIDLRPFVMTLKASAQEPAGVVSVLEAEEPPGFGPPLHIHHHAAEAFYVLEGEYVVFVEDEEFNCPAGTFILIPRGARHGFRVGSVPSRKLNFFFPAAMVGYFDELCAALARGQADDELDAIATRHEMEIVGPVPET